MDAVVLAGLPTELPLKMFHEVLRVLVPGGMVQTSYLVSEHTIAKTEETVNSDLLMGGWLSAEPGLAQPLRRQSHIDSLFGQSSSAQSTAAPKRQDRQHTYTSGLTLVIRR